MNFHKKCAKVIPNLCGIDHTERRGRIRLNIKIQDQKMCIQVFEARNLIPMDPNGKNSTLGCFYSIFQLNKC